MTRVPVMLHRARQSWFLLLLCGLLAAGITQAELLAPLTEWVWKEAVLAAVMLAISITTNFRRLIEGRGNGTAVVLAIALNAGAAPPLGWLLGHALSAELASGLVVAMSVPCTVASAIVWTRRGRGNDVASAVVTLVTNFGCFLLMPFWTGLLLGQSASVDPTRLSLKLAACVAAPMLVGQLLRMLRPVAAWADARKPTLGVFSQLGVLLLAFVGAIVAGASLRAQPVPPRVLEWVALIAVVVLLHLTLLAAAWLLGRGARLADPERLTLLIAGTQKTMAVGIAVAIDYGPLALFPLVAYHCTQLVIDTVIVDRWRAGR